MFLNEKQLRLMVRKSILEGFLSSDIKDISSINANIEGVDYEFSVLGKSQLEGKGIIIFSIPKKVREKIRTKLSQAGIFKLPAKQLKVKHFGATSILDPNSLLASARFYIYEKDLASSSNFKPDYETLKTGKASDSDYAQETLNIVGGIPVIGEPLDFANMCIDIAKKNYLMAAFSALCMIPAVGTYLAFLRSPIKKMPADKAASKIAETMVDAVGQKNAIDAIESAKDIAADFASPPMAEKIKSVAKNNPIMSVDVDEKDVIAASDEVEKVLDAIAEKIKFKIDDAPAYPNPSTALSKEMGGDLTEWGKIVGEFSIHKTLKDMPKSVQDKILNVVRNVLYSMIKSGTVKRSIQSFYKKHIDEVTSVIEERIKQLPKLRAQPDSSDVLELMGEVFFFRKFKLPDPPAGPGGTIDFGAGFDFMEQIEKLGIDPYSKEFKEIMIDRIEEAYEGMIKKASETNLDKVCNELMKKFSNLEINFKISDAGSMATAYPGVSGAWGLAISEKEIAIALTKNLDEKSFLKQINSLSTTIRHEMEHTIDKLMLTTIGLGDSFAQYILNTVVRKGAKYASEKVLGKHLGQRMRNLPYGLIRRNATYEEALQYWRSNPIKQVPGGPPPLPKPSRAEFAGVDNRGYELDMKYDALFPPGGMPASPVEYDKVNKAFHELLLDNQTSKGFTGLTADVIYGSHLKRPMLGSGEDYFNKQLKSIGYSLDPVEAYTRMNRVAEFAKRSGYDITKDEDIIKFFSDKNNLNRVNAYSRDVSGELYTHLFSVFENNQFDSAAKKRALDFIKTAFGVD